MAVQTGTTTTITQAISIEYKCSQCGHQNVARGSISGSAFSSALIRINPYEEARSKIRQQINTLNIGNVPDRYANAELPCSCSACKHVEPWAKLRNRKLPKALFWVPLLITFFIFVPFGTTMEIAPALKVLGLFSGLLPGIIVWAVKQNRRNKIMNEIKALPAECLPKIT